MKKALIVVDAQEYFKNKHTKRIFKNLEKFLQKKFCEYDDVIFLRYVNKSGSGLWKAGFKELTEKDPKAKLAEEVQAFAFSGNTFSRASFSAFDAKGFEQRLKKKNIEQLDLAGFDTQCCIFSTAMNAFDKGFSVRILPNLTGSSFGGAFSKQALKLWELNTG
ncbi:MAG: isochorismatase family protein [Candidatus Diapherotrites archaeon]